MFSKKTTVWHPSFKTLIYTINFQVHPRMRWNKRLKYGCLVCLSSDDFHFNFLFAVVKERNPAELVKGRLMLKFEDSAVLDFNATYQMVESPAFFEAYRHVLTALQVSIRCFSKDAILLRFRILKSYRVLITNYSLL